MEESSQQEGFPRQFPPEAEVTIADERVIPEKPPPDVAMVEGTLGLVTEAEGSSDREAAILGSLGYANPQGDRASPEPSAFEPAAPPTGPPEPDATVLRSFGYKEWQYGRGSPIAASLGLKGGAGDSGNATLLKPLGYLEWQDGRVFAVISDGDGGVCLVTKGDTLEGRFLVVKITPDAVEIVELPAKTTSSAPALQFVRDGKLRSDSAEARPKATSIVELPLAQASSAVALAMALSPKPVPVTDERTGRPVVDLPHRRTALRTPPVAKASQLPASPHGKVLRRHKVPQRTSSTLVPPKGMGSPALREATQARPSLSVSWLPPRVLWTRATDWSASRIP